MTDSSTLDTCRAATGLTLLQGAMHDLDLALNLFTPGGMTPAIREALCDTFDQLDNAHYKLVHTLYAGASRG